MGTYTERERDTGDLVVVVYLLGGVGTALGSVGAGFGSGQEIIVNSALAYKKTPSFNIQNISILRFL